MGNAEAVPVMEATRALIESLEGATHPLPCLTEDVCTRLAGHLLASLAMRGLVIARSTESAEARSAAR